MALFCVESMFLNGLIPLTKRLYYRCEGCGQEIRLHGLWRNLLCAAGRFVLLMALVLVWA
jgi:hypothetical protein